MSDEVEYSKSEVVSHSINNARPTGRFSRKNKATFKKANRNSGLQSTESTYFPPMQGLTTQAATAAIFGAAMVNNGG